MNQATLLQKLKNIIPFLDTVFDDDGKRYRYLILFLLISNGILTIAAVLDLFGIVVHEYIQIMENIFALLFLLEFVLMMVFMYVPEKNIFNLDSIINMIVIASLLAPAFIGNLAILRFLIILRTAHKFYGLAQIQKRLKKIGEN